MRRGRRRGIAVYLAHYPSVWRVNLVVRPDVVFAIPATAVLGGVYAVARCERILWKVEGGLVVREVVEEGEMNAKIPKACEQSHGCDSPRSGYGGWSVGPIPEGLRAGATSTEPI
jgi:hypothetical protein